MPLTDSLPSSWVFLFGLSMTPLFSPIKAPPPSVFFIPIRYFFPHFFLNLIFCNLRLSRTRENLLTAFFVLFLSPRSIQLSPKGKITSIGAQTTAFAPLHWLSPENAMSFMNLSPSADSLFPRDFFAHLGPPAPFLGYVLVRNLVPPPFFSDWVPPRGQCAEVLEGSVLPISPSDPIIFVSFTWDPHIPLTTFFMSFPLTMIVISPSNRHWTSCYP